MIAGDPVCRDGLGVSLVFSEANGSSRRAFLLGDLNASTNLRTPLKGPFFFRGVLGASSGGDIVAGGGRLAHKEMWLEIEGWSFKLQE